MALCLAPLTALHAQTTRLLDASAVSERDDHADLAIDFTCTLRYQSHTPASEGDRLRIILAIGNDCGMVPNAQFAVDRLMPADAVGLVRSIELQPGLAGGAELVISWNRIEKFVLAPSAMPRASPWANPTQPAPGTPSTSNPHSAHSPRWPWPLRLPSWPHRSTFRRLQWRVSSGFDCGLDRLKHGALPRPCCALPCQTIPKHGWASKTNPLPLRQMVWPAQPGTTVTAARRPETRADSQLDALLDEARTAMARKRYDDAISRLTQLVAAEDYQHRIDAAELLGLARERKGQLAQAKAAYEDYLRRYPQSRAANRIRQRLQTLRTAALPGKRGSGGAAAMGDGWTAYGSLSQIYRREDSRLSSSALSRNLVTQNALLTDADGVLRHRGERFDLTARSSFGYAKDLQPAGRSRPLRVSSAFVDLSDRELSLSARLGRQSRGMAGVNGAFDGLLGSWQWHSNFGTSAVVGLPVESTRNGPDTDRTFVGVATDFTTEDRRWTSSAYALAQQYSGRTDRRSVGFETRYLQPGRTLVMMADYDVHFGDINNALLLGTLITDSRWTFNLDASRQRSPMLSIRNALIGQPTLAFDDLWALFTDDELEQLAADRAAQLMQLGFSASHPLGERGQWTVNLLSVNLTGTPASGGVAAVPNPGRDDSLSTELLINSLFRAGDTHSLALRYQRGDTGRLLSAGFGSRLPFGSALRITTRLRIDRRSLPLDGSSQWAYVPSLRLDYQRGASSFELEAGAELSRRTGGLAEHSTRRFLSAGYRLFLDRNRQ
jgi:tetratricopeptide (TPR) repeat protein